MSVPVCVFPAGVESTKKQTKRKSYFICALTVIIHFFSLKANSIPSESGSAINQIKSNRLFITIPTAQIYIYNYDNLLCDRNMVVELCCYAGLSGSSAGLGIELALFSSRS